MDIRVPLSIAHSLVVRTIQRFLGIKTLGVRAMVLNDQREVLLVEHTYMPGWHFPGGGVNVRESTEEAALRELVEEAGITTKSRPKLFGMYLQMIRGASDYVAVYVVEDFEQGEKAPCLEIRNVRWWPVDALPADASPATRQRLDEYLGRVGVSQQWC